MEHFVTNPWWNNLMSGDSNGVPYYQVAVSNNNRTLTTKRRYDCIMAYGATIIDFQQQKIHKWKFKINQCPSGQCPVGIAIGIDDASMKWCIANCQFYSTASNPNSKNDIYVYGMNGSGKGKGYKCFTGKFESYGPGFQAGDVVEMMLDCKKRQLSYIINNVDAGIVFENIKPIKYRLAVDLCSGGHGITGITLMDYTQVNSNENVVQEIKSNEPEKKLNDDLGDAKIKTKEIGAEVILWLRDEVELPEYIPIFIENGFDDMRAIKIMDKDDLDEIGIQKLGHKKRIIFCIEELNKKSLVTTDQVEGK
eukprot:95451_1